MRSLLLAGGGVKVAYQAGCLQVLLDEAKLTFDHVDGTSGGCLNAALLASGKTGTQIADAWRQLNPSALMAFNFREYPKGLGASSLGTFQGLRERVFPEWGLDFERIRAGVGPVVTFNVFDFSQKQLVVLENTELDSDLLCGCVALPIWFPPVVRQGTIYLDAVFFHDANVSEAIRRGADELWAIWTVEDIPEYRDGFASQYFHIVEVAANGHFFADWDEIARVNAAIAEHGPDRSRQTTDLRLFDLPRRGEGTRLAPLPPPGRKPIQQHLIQQQVPLHYLLNLSQDRVNLAVEMGVRDAREYCVKVGLLPESRIAPHRVEPPTRPIVDLPVGIEFTETMRGYWAQGSERHPILFRITIRIEDVEHFLHTPEHAATATGYIESEALGGRLELTKGHFNLFTDSRQGGVPAQDNPLDKRMLYHLAFRGGPSGENHYLLVGEKRIHDDPGHDLWDDTTTLFTTLYRTGEVGDHEEREMLGEGVLRIYMLDFIQQLTTFRTLHAHSPREAAGALTRFGQFFLGQLWDVYARHVLEYAPF